jgi:predicted nucleotidyltransferase component of viral defense system
MENIAASVHQRLLNKAKEFSRPFNELLQYYAIERFIYRLSMTAHAKRFILKGALMFRVWNAPVSRSTRDIDFLGRIDNSTEAIAAAMKVACEKKVKADGMTFDSKTVTATIITEGADYAGVRVRLRGNLGNARISLQVDIGFADVVFPDAAEIAYPTILDFPAPNLKGYSMESTIAEKLQAMVKLGILNSRMKDFYDIWLLSHQFDFKGLTLATAIERTFGNRKTALSAEPEVFQSSFSEDITKQAQWRAFVRRARLEDTPMDFNEVVAGIRDFLYPILKALAEKQRFQKKWTSPGPWRPPSS